jgi:sterol desaturase/sphingolipid hydroxylase (fatty acid hydroxylase superfamily)
MLESLSALPLKSVLVPATLVVLLVLEHMYPLVQWTGGLWRMGRNLGLSLINATLAPVIIIPVTMYAAGHTLNWRPDTWTGWPFLLADLLLLDLWIYWWHRINHVLPFLWRFHEIHHLDDTLDATSALRFHFGEVVLSSLVRAGVMIVLDVPLISVVVFESVVALSALFHHSNLALPVWLERPLSKVIVTPSIHWVHHHALRRDTDSNYATILSVWDRVFSSRSATIRTPDLPVGVEGMKDKRLLHLALRPFTRHWQ